ncbi:MAG: hypothetical protein V1929_10165 [bacterium]
MRQVLLVSYDAGGAEMLSAWCEARDASDSLTVCAEGPADGIFRRDWPALPRAGLDAMDRFTANDLVLTGTSLEADLERRAMARARKLGIHCVSFLDHWDLYVQRFDAGDRPGTFTLPDELWVGDPYAYQYAVSQGLPSEKLVVVDNPYVRKVRRLAAAYPGCRADGRRRLLYVCEPFTIKLRAIHDALEGFVNEDEHLGQFLDAARAHRGDIERITVRLHPRDARERFDEIVRSRAGDLPVRLSNEASLVADIMQHDTLVGVESMALVVGLVVGRTIYSCIPGRTWTISLPHPGIHRITTFESMFPKGAGDRFEENTV